MDATNCKPGDLAIVVNTELLQNLGQIVEVMGLQTGTPFIMSGHGPVWQVRAASGRATLVYRFNEPPVRFEAYAEGPVPDRCLRPISGLTDGDAVRTNFGKKLGKPRRKSKPAFKATEEALS